MRHGHSVANEKSKIVSAPKVGCSNFGLTVEGQNQVQRSAEHHADLLSTLSMIYTSDFLRAVQTAETIASNFNIQCKINVGLRERYFGIYEGRSTDFYSKIWEADLTGTHDLAEQVETVNAVARRMTDTVLGLEEEHPEGTILLVSHGDPLQILLTRFNGVSPKSHRLIPQIDTAEIIPLKRHRKLCGRL
ncbi:MAG: histidine phosphatase family protein [Rubripirellula sp.]|nr:histidine phosphatase family protein [Rubripirellula sp.]